MALKNDERVASPAIRICRISTKDIADTFASLTLKPKLLPFFFGLLRGTVGWKLLCYFIQIDNGVVSSGERRVPKLDLCLEKTLLISRGECRHGCFVITIDTNHPLGYAVGSKIAFAFRAFPTPQARLVCGTEGGNHWGWLYRITHIHTTNGPISHSGAIRGYPSGATSSARDLNLRLAWRCPSHREGVQFCLRSIRFLQTLRVCFPSYGKSGIPSHLGANDLLKLIGKEKLEIAGTEPRFTQSQSRDTVHP